jgi:hypothetical protein
VLDKEDGVGSVGRNQGEKREGYILQREVYTIAARFYLENIEV